MSDLEDACFMRDKFAQYLVGDRILNRIKSLQAGDTWAPGGFTSIIGAENDPLNLPKVPPLLRAHLGFLAPDMPSVLPEIPPHIGILGAGISGLFLALLIDEINEMVSPKKLFTYSILESSGRNGGRVLTKQFDDEIWNDYYDVGAMRFPDVRELSLYISGLYLHKAPLDTYHEAVRQVNFQ